MIQEGLNRILKEIEKIKIEKNKAMKEEKDFYEKFKEFSNSFDKLCKNFCDYISSIKDRDIIDNDISKNINIYKTKFINKIESFKNIKNTKIIELSKLFNENINFNAINDLIDDTLDVKINIIENEFNNLTFDKPKDKNESDYSKFYDNLKNSQNSITISSEKEKNDSVSDIFRNNTLKCYGCENEGTVQCINEECCNFLFCQNCSEKNFGNDVKINHNLKKVDKECIDKERRKEKFLDLISEICNSFFIKSNFLFEKEKFPIFPNEKDENWEKKYFDNIEQFYTPLNENNKESSNLKETKICKRLIKKFLDKINFKLDICFYFVDFENIYNEYKRNSNFNCIDDQFVFNQKSQIPNYEKRDIREIDNSYNYYCRDNIKETPKKEKETKKKVSDIIVDDNRTDELSTKTPKSGENRPKKSISEVAEEVIRGEWGNGLIRRNKLKNAGYDFNRVQNEINRKLFSKK